MLNPEYVWDLTDDEKWVEQLSSQLFHDKPIEQVTPEDMYSALIEMKKREPDCEDWTFGGCVFVTRPFFVFRVE